MAKLIELHEAARILGISPDALTELRSRNQIFGYRDGSTWKFKLEELERVKADLASAGGMSDTLSGDGELDELVDVDKLALADEDDLGIDLDLGDSGDLADDIDALEPAEGADSDSILVSEEELGQSDENTASTIIGEADDLLPQDSGIGGSDALAGASDLELSLESSDAVAASDILADVEDKPLSASDTANLKLAGSSNVGDSVKLQGSGSLEFALDDSAVGSRIELADDDAVQASSSGFGSAIELGLDDDELVLGSGAGSDVTAGAGDSGISLGNPSDSGLSLEEPLALTDGSGVESLELGEDDLPDLGDAASGTAADDDFMLTPVEDGLDEESDSGSQVIALDNEEFDEGSAVEMLTEDDEDLEGVEAAEFIPDGAELATAGVATGAALAGGPAGIARDDAEETFTVWNVLSLFSVVLVLGFTGILMLDLINNMWSWQGNFSFNSTIMDAILNLMP